MGNEVATAERVNLGTEVGEAIDRVLAGSPADAASMVFVDHPEAESMIRAVVAWPAPQPLLTDTCALFEKFGLQVARQHSLDVGGDHGRVAVSLFDFLAPPRWQLGSPAKVAAAFEARGAHGFAIDDYARLIVSADVGWREVMLLRSAARFLRQAGLGMSASYVIATLDEHPDFVAALVAYFSARFDPDVADRDAVSAAALADLNTPIEATTTVDEDRILRAFASFASATLRTNWFQMQSDGTLKRYASFMLDSAALQPRGPLVPYREIFVDSEDVEGIHARSGPIARGGLRFSDRPEDYRTEVLGLMKTQTVKNSPIVPVGAKGAFVRKNPAISAEQAYRTFIAGLLDVTDNRTDTAVVSPPRTVVYGGQDSYLVVAADKGTARFSDLANDIAVQRDFWLGDAFASGGSAGYDHKAMGITARGAWVSVRRHFADLGLDVDRDRLRVVGIGDMSGDVFGNGMLLSRSMCLIASFDHRHIFIDPNPDPEISYAQRQRLAQLPASSWADYDPAALSTGGGVWPRTAKKIVLPAAAGAALGITAEALSPAEVIRAILSAEVDLLWNGGIGTYVKSARESHAEAADPANDAIRIDASQLRARVVGEGGNLGFTQRARIDVALAGGRINADFIDNAAGVATSDREVNLKIALDSARLGGRITAGQRGAMLAGAEDEVAHAVLRGAENQVLAISLAEAQAAQLLNRHERLIENFERVSGITRVAEMLPTRADLVSRTRDGRGLTRPEIAVLLAHSKNVVRDELLASEVPDNPVFVPALRSYFPSQFQQQLGPDIAAHRLAREIIATQIADDLINHVGPGLIYQLEERLGVPASAVAGAYAVIRELFGVDALWQEAHAPAGISSAQRWDALLRVQQFIEHTAARLLRHHGGRIDIGATIERYRPGVVELSAAGVADQQWQQLRLEAFDLSHTASTLAVPIAEVAATYLALNDLLDLRWITDGLTARAASTWWEAMGVAAVRDELADTHHRLTAAVLRVGRGQTAAVAHWQEVTATPLARFARMRAELGRDNVVDVARAATVHAELLLLCRHAESPFQ
jgi:glutamate dehydrogenase